MPITKHTTRPTFGLWALLVALCVAVSGCGGSAADTPAVAGEASGAVTTTNQVDDADPAESTEAAAAVEALLATYYDAYNAGDSDGVLAILSDIIVETPPGNVRFWIDVLEEQVSADCIASPTNPSTCAASRATPTSSTDRPEPPERRSSSTRRVTDSCYRRWTARASRPRVAGLVDALAT